jgi:excisionase family DNA binding protein
MVERILTAEEVTKLLRVSIVTVYRLAKGGKIPAFKVGTDWRFTVEAVDKFMKSCMPLDDDPELS